MLFHMHGLTCEFKCPSRRMSILLDHLVSCHCWTIQDVEMVQSRLPKCLKSCPQNQRFQVFKRFQICVYKFICLDERKRNGRKPSLRSGKPRNRNEKQRSQRRHESCYHIPLKVHFNVGLQYPTTI